MPPDDIADGAVGSGPGGRLWRADRGSTRVEGAANQAAGIMGLSLAALVARRGRMAQADFGSRERVGNDRRKGPARADRCKNLHHQRDHEDREISLKPPHHQKPVRAF